MNNYYGYLIAIDKTLEFIIMPPLPPAQHAVFIRNAVKELNKATKNAYKDNIEVEFIIKHPEEDLEYNQIDVKISKLL